MSGAYNWGTYMSGAYNWGDVYVGAQHKSLAYRK